MRVIGGLVVLASAIPAMLPAQSGEFLVRLGRDTLAIERYTRTVHRLYTATFGPSGALERFELITHNVDGGPGPLERKATATFSGDSVVMTIPRDDSTATMRVKTGPGALPYIGQGYALVEEVARRGRAAGGDRYSGTMLPLGTDEPWKVDVSRLGADSLTLQIGPIGPLRMRVDERAIGRAHVTPVTSLSRMPSS